MVKKPLYREGLISKHAGEIYGKLRLLRPVGRDSHGHVLWFVQCECYKVEVRPRFSLRRAVKRGHVPMCVACRMHASSERSWKQQQERRQQGD